MSAPIFTASSRRLGEKSAATIGRMPFSRRAAMTASPTGPQPTTSGASSPFSAPFSTACTPTASGSVSAACSGRQPVGHFQQQRRGQQHLLGIAADIGVGVAHALRPIGLHHQRHGADARARASPSARCRARSPAPRSRIHGRTRRRATGPSARGRECAWSPRPCDGRAWRHAGPSRRCRRPGS